MNLARARASLPPLLTTAVGYVVAGWLAMLLTMPPGHGSPLFPPAGLALAMVMVYGPSVLPGVTLGSFFISFVPGLLHGHASWASMATALAIGIGATTQAAVGAGLARRFVAQPLTLSEPRDVARFFALAAFAASTISPTFACATLWFVGAMPTAQVPANWATWWAGDALGVLIAAPITLTFIGRPREDWVPRRATVSLPLLLVAALLVMAITYVGRWDDQRTRGTFERDAADATQALSVRLHGPLYALEAVRGVFLVEGRVTADQLRRVSAPWLSQPLYLQAVAWSEQVPRSEVEDFERRARAEGPPQFKVFERPDGAALTAADRDMIILRYIEPTGANSKALGVNVLSIPATRQAIETAKRGDEPVASAGFRLTQERGDQIGVVIYRAIQAGASLRGLVSVVMRMDDVANAVMSQHPSYLQWCLLDMDAKAAHSRLAGPAGCELAAPATLFKRQHLTFAGRQWEFRVSADRAAVPESERWTAAFFLLAGLMTAAILGALLLTVTGRTRRIKVAVEERTAALQREVGERQRTETALRESERRFRNIFEHVPIGVFYADLRGTIRESNPKFRQLTGYSGEELADMTAPDLTHPEDREDDAELSRRLVKGEMQMYRRQKRYLAKDGRTLWVQATVTVLRDSGGSPQRLVGVVEDITEHLKLLDAERARESAEAANRAKSDFLSRMSHELRTPLNAMLGFAQLLELDQAHPLTTKQLEWTSQIRQAGWHLLHMINDTLDLSRIESGTLKLDVAELELASVVMETRALVEQSASLRGIMVTQSLDPDARFALGDSTRVKQILTNLMSNAVKYNAENGHVHVAVSCRDLQTVEIAITDTGPGLNAQQMAELFQPFNRLGREKSGVEGTGIGLVISQRLAELMGGSLQAHSIRGEGSTFVLTLPRALRQTYTPALTSDESDLPPGYRHRLVHYVEDNETNAEVMRGILAQRPQVILTVSATGQEALQALHAKRPDLILLDMHLPDMDGLDLLARLKEDPDTASIPVVVVSADAMASRMDTAIHKGAVHYLTKPVSVAEILGVLDDLLESMDTRWGAESSLGSFFS